MFFDLFPQNGAQAEGLPIALGVGREGESLNAIRYLRVNIALYARNTFDFP